MLQPASDRQGHALKPLGLAHSCLCRRDSSIVIPKVRCRAHSPRSCNQGGEGTALLPAAGKGGGEGTALCLLQGKRERNGERKGQLSLAHAISLVGPPHLHTSATSSVLLWAGCLDKLFIVVSTHPSSSVFSILIASSS